MSTGMSTNSTCNATNSVYIISKGGGSQGGKLGGKEEKPKSEHSSQIPESRDNSSFKYIQ